MQIFFCNWRFCANVNIDFILTFEQFLYFFLQAFAKQFRMTPDDLDMHVIYDVSHNIAKVEEHFIDGKLKTLLVHRKVIALSNISPLNYSNILSIIV